MIIDSELVRQVHLLLLYLSAAKPDFKPVDRRLPAQIQDWNTTQYNISTKPFGMTNMTSISTIRLPNPPGARGFAKAPPLSPKQKSHLAKLERYENRELCSRCRTILRRSGKIQERMFDPNVVATSEGLPDATVSGCVLCLLFLNTLSEKEKIMIHHGKRPSLENAKALVQSKIFS